MALIDIKKQFDNIKDAAASAVEAIFPVKGKHHEIALLNVWVDDSAEPGNFSEQLKVKDREGTWGASVYGSFTLKDLHTNKIIDREKKVKLFTLPKITPRASYIVKGNEYQVASQLRLRSGAYVKTMKNGGFKTQFNLAKGRGSELHFNDNGIIFIQLGSGPIPLRPLLQGLGISDAKMKEKWGSKVYENQLSYTRVSKEEAVKRFHKKMIGEKAPESVETAKDNIKTFIKDKTEILPEMTKLTLGKGFTTFNPELWLEASSKLVAVEKGEKEPDDVDSLAFKEFYGIDDSIKERIEKNKRAIGNKVRRNLDKKTKIRSIITASVIGGFVESFFLDDDRASTPEQHNPLQMYSGNDKVTYMGPGSITSTHAVTDEMRTVHPTHFGFIDPVHTPEGSKIGLTLNLAMGTSKKNNTLVTSFYDVKTKKFVEKNTISVHDKNVAYPDQWDPKTKKLKGTKIKVQYKGKIRVVKPSEVDFILPFSQNVFSLSTNLIPFMASDNGNRTMMAGKHMEQAISLKDREVPLVQNKMSNSSQTLEGLLGAADALYATNTGAKGGTPIQGVVSKITGDHIFIKDGKTTHKINKYKDFTLNQKTFMNHDATVEVGDTLKPGQLIADTNYTKDGTLALGTNLKAAYIPYKGYNFEDGIVLSERGAKKLTSEHIHKIQLRLQDSVEFNLPKFSSFFPNELSLSNVAKLDKEGIMKVGQTVEPGDVVIAALKKTGGLSQSELIRSSFHKSLGRNAKPLVEAWKYDVTGKVIKIKRNASQLTVLIRTEEQARIGDKLAGRHGNKGIITKIIPDNLTPKTADGDPVDILLNPHGVISRINIGQMYESALGKIAKKKGGIARIENFTGENYLETVKGAMKKSGINDKEQLFDPETGKSLGDIHVGNPYILKLNKQSEVNFAVRGESGPVSGSTMQPSKGGDEGSKAIDLLSIYSLLSHGARVNLKEMSSLKSENNPEFWEALKYGRYLPAPKSPFVFEKLLAKMKGLGIDVKKKGTQMQLSPLTDKQTLAMSSMEITKPQFIRRADGVDKITKGGFLDLTQLGGAEGDKWGHIKLKETTVNPIFDDAIKSLTKLKKTEYEAILNGQQRVDVNGKSMTGGEAIRGLLNNVDVKSEMKKEENNLKSKVLGKRTSAIKRFRYLNVLDEKGITAGDAYTRKYIPVVPPKFRPISPMDDKSFAVDDTNWMYRDIALIDKHMQAPAISLLEDEDLVDVRKEFNKRLKGLAGLEVVKMSGRDKVGIITQIKGKDQPKEGFFQSKVLKKNQNLVGRGTIIPEPTLGIDEAAIPKEMAWGLYSPFIIKELIKNGYSALQAKEEVKKKTPNAKNVLDRVMANRPVMLNRAPSLHKFSLQSFIPKITSGKAIKIPPLVVGGFNADFDGDTMTVHVPITDAAVRESYKMMPSQNLWKPGTGSLMIGPSQESQLGFYLMTKDAKDRVALNKVIPSKFKIKGEMNKGESKKLFMDLSKSMPKKDFGKLIDVIKKMGENAAYTKGFTLGIGDLDLLKGKNIYAEKLEQAAQLVRSGKATAEDLSKAYGRKGGVQDQIDNKINNQLKGKKNSFYEMMNSGAKGNKGQLRQIIASPFLVQDHKGGVIPSVIKKSFAEGLDLSDYWSASYGARKGMMDKGLSTSEPGVFNKSIIATTMSNVVSKEDCGTKDGIFLPIGSTDLLGRFIQGTQGGVLDETIIDGVILKKLKKARLPRVFVRSPLKCIAAEGTCRHCFGIDENGSLVNIGDNLGVKAGQTIAEPLTQLVLNTFHTGGIAGTGKKGGYDRIKELFSKDVSKGRGVLSRVDGTVNKIEASGLGGYNIFVDGNKHVTPPHQTKLVSEGQKIKKGDQLNKGSISPQEMLKYKGLVSVQDYMTDELKQAYGDQGVNIDRKTFETVVKSVTGNTMVLNNIKDRPWLPGQTISYTMAEDYNKNRTEGQEKLNHMPSIKGFQNIPESREDWMAQMGATHIKNAIIKGSSQGWMTDLGGYHPMPAYAYGATFGEGKDGRY